MGRLWNADEEHTNEVATSLNDRFKKDSYELADILKKERKERLRDIFDLNERYTFIRELFDNNPVSFDQTLKDLESCNDAEEVLDYMEQNFMDKISEEEKSDHFTKFTALIIQNVTE